MDERILWLRKIDECRLPVIGQTIGYNDITSGEHFQGKVVEIAWDAEKNMYRVRLVREPSLQDA